jgi:hypothetical protein
MNEEEEEEAPERWFAALMRLGLIVEKRRRTKWVQNAW